MASSVNRDINNDIFIALKVLHWSSDEKLSSCTAEMMVSVSSWPGWVLSCQPMMLNHEGRDHLLVIMISY